MLHRWFQCEQLLLSNTNYNRTAKYFFSLNIFIARGFNWRQLAQGLCYIWISYITNYSQREAAVSRLSFFKLLHFQRKRGWMGAPWNWQVFFSSFIWRFIDIISLSFSWKLMVLVVVEVAICSSSRLLVSSLLFFLFKYIDSFLKVSPPLLASLPLSSSCLVLSCLNSVSNGSVFIYGLSTSWKAS